MRAAWAIRPAGNIDSGKGLVGTPRILNQRVDQSDLSPRDLYECGVLHRAMVPACRNLWDATMGVSSTVAGNIKVIGSNGQISLGKRYAGRQVLVEEQEPGVWLIRTATVVPDNERWIHQPQALADLENALAWAKANPPSDEGVDRVLAKLNDDA